MEKKLMRSRRVKVFGGVCGGLASYFNIDPILVRVIFVVLAITRGIGLLLYIILWIVVPEEPFELAYPFNPDPPNNPDQPNNSTNNLNDLYQVEKRSSSGRLIFGIVLIAIGLLFMVERYFFIFDFSDIFPIVLIIIGASLLINSLKK